uniref:uncharacterized protein K02A2.6 isoform X1 n=1 Tax=Ciona intestinalis TaxID=7719 RepID=UPI000EF50B18|nr:uncharacterized protein K02A2.6 isoform X1 [Ciona intestinalis]|eukprot:XP_026689427.1 uncharacterized protein K02A2.6 isoform X1 [Ciona intestinalis]
MEGRLLRPKELSVDPTSPDAATIFKYWLRTVKDFITTLEESQTSGQTAVNKKRIIISCLSPTIYPYVEECETYGDIIEILSRTFIRRKNNIYARHLLVSRRQVVGETIAEYLQQLKMLAKECVFTDVTKEKYRDELTRDAFINGLNSTAIRQRLLEVDELDLRKAHELADSLDRAQHYATMNVASTSTTPPFTASLSQTSRIGEDLEVGPLAQATAVTRPDRFTSRRPCPFCGEPDHKRTVCPARYSTCFKCGKRGHFSKVCRAYDRGRVSTITQGTYSRPYLSSILASAPNCLEPAIVTGTLAGATVDILLDTGASNNFIDRGTARKARLSLNKVIMSINMAAGSNPTKTFGRTKATLSFLGRKYVDVTFDIIEGLCADVILGQDFLKMHSEVTFKLGGDADKLIIPYVPMEIAALSAAKVSPPRLFEFMDRHAQPYASRSRQYSREDQAFIRSEVQRLIASDIIEASRSPWRAQVLVVKESTKKKRMVIDYSQTVNRYTQLDAYPLPKIEQIVNSVAADTFYSSLDLRSAYHQVPLLYHERPYTAFEADGCLYQYKRLPFGVTNGVSAFQRVIDRFIARHQLKKVYAYLDDITVTGSTLQEHDKNLNALLHAAQQDNLTFNEDKSKFRVTTLDLLGYRISFGNIRPDPHRLQPLLQLPPPKSSKELKRIVASLGAIQDDLPFEVESDASDYAIAAILSQNGRPVAFMSRTLNSTERHYPAVEKEATAIVEAVRKWSHFLKGRSFSLITDQRSVAFMFDQKNRGKIKNSKLLMWRLELSQYDYKIRHKPGISNVAPDTFSRVCSHVNSRQDLCLLHRSLGHPGFARFYHFIKGRNLPFTSEETKQVCRSCQTCAEVKPRFYKPQEGTLVKSIQPWERLSIDFKGPVRGRNPYLLIVVDEYSRYPFVFPCKSLSSTVVIECLSQLFCLFGFPAYIHSDRGASFVSKETKEFLFKRNIATSTSTPYHPKGNSQCERINQTIWRTIKLMLHDQSHREDQWEDVLPEALHAVRSLLCTSTNCTPHERLFTFSRRSMTGTSMPTWLLSPGQVLLRRYVRSKGDPLCDQVELLNANNSYANIRHNDGRESTVSTSDLAPCPSPTHNNSNQETTGVSTSDLAPCPSPTHNNSNQETTGDFQEPLNDSCRSVEDSDQPPIRRSTRTRKPPVRYGDWAS